MMQPNVDYRYGSSGGNLSYANLGHHDLLTQSVPIAFGLLQFGVDLSEKVIEKKGLEKSASIFGAKLAGIGGAITVYDGVKNGWQKHHTADLAINVTLTGGSLLTAFAPAIGTAMLIPGVNITVGGAIAIVGTAYFVTDMSYYLYTSVTERKGKTITEKIFD